MPGIEDAEEQISFRTKRIISTTSIFFFLPNENDNRKRTKMAQRNLNIRLQKKSHHDRLIVNNLIHIKVIPQSIRIIINVLAPEGSGTSPLEFCCPRQYL